GFST
ncbi:hypothetical protein CP03DC29_0391B, partial [Chlamydia psittaci 03DC29]